MCDLKEKTCCFTGHRELSDYETEIIKIKLEKEVEMLIKKGTEKGVFFINERHTFFLA